MSSSDPDDTPAKTDETGDTGETAPTGAGGSRPAPGTPGSEEAPRKPGQRPKHNALRGTATDARRRPLTPRG